MKDWTICESFRALWMYLGWQRSNKPILVMIHFNNVKINNKYSSLVPKEMKEKTKRKLYRRHYQVVKRLIMEDKQTFLENYNGLSIHLDDWMKHILLKVLYCYKRKCKVISIILHLNHYTQHSVMYLSFTEAGQRITSCFAIRNCKRFGSCYSM